MMALWIVALIVAIPIGIDAKRQRVSITKKPYSLNTGAIAWAASCLVLPYLCSMILGPLGFLIGLILMIGYYALRRKKSKTSGEQA
jgi:hypothetical protein